MSHIDRKQLYEWCRSPAEDLLDHPSLRVPFRTVRDSSEMGQVMARDFVSVIQANNGRGLPARAIDPCGPTCWYGPFTQLVNAERLSLQELTVFHMDECLDWASAGL